MATGWLHIAIFVRLAWKIENCAFASLLTTLANPILSAYNSRQVHPLHLVVPWSTTTYYQMSFFPKTIQDWNKLPHRIIESESLN